MTAHEAAAFRRDTIGAVPQDLGLIPELRMIDQIALPMKLAGMRMCGSCAAMTDVFQEAIRAIYAASKPSTALWAYQPIGDNETCSRSPKD